MTDAQNWVSANARPLGDFGPVIAAAQDAAVVGIGENTREAAEIDHHRIRLARELVEHAGYRVIVVPDSANVGERMDEYVLGSRSDLREIVLSGWLPNRTKATEGLLEWVRAFNEGNEGDPVRIVGNGPRQAEPADYDAVLAYAEKADPEAASAIAKLYDVIRTAHEVNEHIQIHKGVHPGRPFSESAEEAAVLVGRLPDGEGKDEARGRAGLIGEFHGASVAAQQNFNDMTRGIADRILKAHEESGRKVVYMDGFALTGVVSDVEVAVKPGERFSGAGKWLRDRFGERYVSVLFAFGRGTIRDGMRVPIAQEGNVERALVDAGAGDVLLPFRGTDGAWADGSFGLRVVAGIYEPEDDEKFSMDIASLRESVDYLGFVDTVSETALLE
ncbi:erythromycin esterase family protein [Salininema proteolyticum]|uniref:Erythromycin esterase family protein n=1 Tax=Salininema proteolyticum TaxID=1607685 RepID=A0ABV8U242_9ACTN